jgi:adenylate cyclase
MICTRTLCRPFSRKTSFGTYEEGKLRLHARENKAILEYMPPDASEAVRRQVDRVLASSGFARNDRLCRFLQFVVERHLGDRDSEIKESVIAVEVFGRRPDFSSKRDPIVRTEAARLRARLNEYYLNGGRRDPLIIDLPKGGYVPVFREACATPAVAPEPDKPDRQPSTFRFTLGIALAFVCAVVSGALIWRALQPTAPIPIAVLPLENRGHDADGDYFSDGLTSEIISDLSMIDGMTVRSQTSSFAFKGKPRHIREAGKQLNADYILEGSVFREAQKLRINVQLIRVRDDVPIWSDRFDRELKDVLAIQDEISRGIVNSLRVHLGRGRRRYEIKAEAYDLYLRARSLQVQVGIGGYDQSIAPLEAALAKDPSFAPAYAALAVAYAFRSGQFRFNIVDQTRRMRAAADDAIRLDPVLAEGHAALGLAHAREGEWQSAEQSFHRAIELNPGDSQPYRHLAFFVLFPLGRISEALQQFSKAEKLDPLGAQTHYETASALMTAGRYTEAEAHCEKLPADFTMKNVCLLWARLRQGRLNEVIAAAEREFHRRDQLKDSLGDLHAVLGCAYARDGRRQDAEEVAADTFDPFGQAYIFACLGDKDRAIEALDRATPAGFFRIGRALQAPEYAVLRGDPRLKSVRKKVGLPE